MTLGLSIDQSFRLLDKSKLMSGSYPSCRTITVMIMKLLSIKTQVGPNLVGAGGSRKMSWLVLL